MRQFLSCMKKLSGHGLVCVCVCVCVCVGTRGRQQPLDHEQLRDTGCAVAEQTFEGTVQELKVSHHDMILYGGAEV